jgi:hypothetical protein
MVDAFPLPRHREKLCCAGSQISYEVSKLNGTVVRRRSTTRSCAEITRAILADIQRAIELLQITMSHDGSRRFTFSGIRDVLAYHGTHDDVDNNNRRKNSWKKLPKMRKKPFDGWPVQEVSEGRASLRTTSPPIDEDDAFSNDHKRNSRASDTDNEGHREYGLAMAVQRTPTPQSEKAHPVHF